ncbi:hypothetical protein [Bacillus infantis]|uniref:hypothetical protein n=1 Tax=Bacillus infantis TaxID=324767 RepID=UPI003CE7DCF5
MPTVLDATVVNQAYDTSGNGGRKLVRLDDGRIVTVVKDSANKKVRTYVSNDGTSFTEVGTGILFNFNLTDVAIVAIDNNKIGLTVTHSLQSTSNYTMFYTGINVDTGELISNNSVDTGQTAVGNVSLAINEAGTELHAAWASKNATYPNSFNIRYAKGTINADGSVTWSAVEQRTTLNTTGSDNKNPCIVLVNGNPSIIYDFYNGSTYAIRILNYNGTSWNTVVDIYSVASYIQSSPSAIFVPQSVNGLANGRIWVAWVGKDSTDTTADNLRFSYSDDGGVTWSTMTKLTSGNTLNQFVPSMTFDKSGEVFIVWEAQLVASGYRNIRKIKHTDGVWSPIVNVTNSESAHSKNPSTLLSSDFDVTEPLFIYQGASKVGFYGTWTTTTISVTPGSIGQVSDKNNLLSYTITTDGTMSAITEKVNGVTVGTKTAASGTPLIAGLTQEQWDEIAFGKYTESFGANLLPGFSNAGWVKHANATVISDTELSINSTSSADYTTFDYTAKPNQEYYFSVETNGRMFIRYLDSVNNLISSSYIPRGNGTFTTTSNTVKVRIYLSSSTEAPVGVYTFKNPFLMEGSPHKDNTLTIEMGSEKWTYTFDKQPDANSDIISTVKAVKDAVEVSTPAKLAKLASAIRSKGGTVNDADSIEVMAEAVGGIELGKKFATGTVTSSAGVALYSLDNGASVNRNYVSVTGLYFPNGIAHIELVATDFSDLVWGGVYNYSTNSQIYGTNLGLMRMTGNANMRELGFALPVNYGSKTYTYRVWGA